MKFADCPACTVLVPDPDGGGSTKSGAVPVPPRLTFCAAVPSAVTANVAMRSPVADGVNTTVMVQLALTASVVLQVLLPILNPAAFVPAREPAIFDRGNRPLLSMVTFICPVFPTATCPKEIDGLEREKVGTAPVPLRLAFWIPPGTLLVTEIVACFVPVDAGANVTLMMQLAPAARPEPQLDVWLKLAASDPVRLIPRLLAAAKPEFCTVMLWAVDDVPVA